MIRYKKITLAAALAVIFFLSIMLTSACSKSEYYSDTYRGAISKEEYATFDLAVSEFLRNEINGSTISVKSYEYVKAADLTIADVESLELGDMPVSDVVSAEKGKVTYSYYSELSKKTVRNSSSLYILQSYNSSYRYYTPELLSDDVLTKSYYYSVMDASNYVNITQQMVITIDVPGISMTALYIVQISDDAGYVKLASMGDVIEYYMVQTDNGVSVFVYDTTEGMSGFEKTNELGSYNKVSDMFGFKSPSLDHTYFIKTNYGFTLSSEKYEEFFIEYSGDTLKYVSEFECTANYYVTNGLLSRQLLYVSVKSENESGNMSIDVTFSNLGATKVNIPADITHLL